MIANILVLTMLISVSQAVNLVHYTLSVNLSITPEHRESLIVGEMVKVESNVYCMLRCNKHPDCHTVSLESDVNCTLFNNQTALYATEVSSDTVLWSTTTLQMCPVGKYYEETNKVCKLKKKYDETCSGLIINECIAVPKFGCMDGRCQCLGSTK